MSTNETWTCRWAVPTISSRRQRPFMREIPLSAPTTRRNLLTAAAVGATAAVIGPKQQAEAAASAPPKVRYCLNMSTIRGQKLAVPDLVDLASKAGYDAIEPWINELRQYQQGGGSIDDLRKRIV